MFSGNSPFGQRQQPRNQDMRIAAQIDLRDVVLGKSLVAQIQLGSGRIETINIDVPPGARDGDTIQYEGLGDDRHRELRRGNLHVVVQVKPVSGWERRNNDLITRKTINLFDLLLGCVIIVNTLDNRNVKLTIPKGTNPGQRFSIPEYGIPDINTRRRGNIHVIIDVKTPEINDESLLNKIQQLRDEIK
jgi:molecular chaperone DnaJ